MHFGITTGLWGNAFRYQHGVTAGPAAGTWLRLRNVHVDAGVMYVTKISAMCPLPVDALDVTVRRGCAAQCAPPVGAVRRQGQGLCVGIR